MKSSPFQIVLLAVFGALAVAGVLIFALVVSGGNSSAVGPVTLWGTFDDARVTAVLRAAAETDDRLSNVTYVRKDPATYETDLVNALASGTGPDLFFIRDDRAVFDGAKTIHIPFSSLSETQFKNTFLDAARPFVASDGVVAVPLVADPLVLFWNKDFLAAAGMTAPPRYWDEFIAVGKRLTQQSDAGVIKQSAVALGEYDNIDNAQDILSALILQAGGAITVADNTGKLYSGLAPQQGSTGQPSLSALRFYTQFADPSQDDYSWNRSLPESRTAFAQGSVALYIGHASESSLIASTNPNLNYAMAPMPQVRDARPLNVATVYGLAVPRTAKNPLGGRTIAYILSSPAISQGFATVFNMATALRGVLSQATDVSKAQASPGTLQGLLASAPASDRDLVNNQAYIASYWLNPDPDATAQIFRAMIEDTVSGASKPQDSLSRADKALNQLLGL